jgi:hypothetical protein
MLSIKIINEEIDTPYLAVSIKQANKPEVILRGGEGMIIDATQGKIVIEKINNVDIQV